MIAFWSNIHHWCWKFHNELIYTIISIYGMTMDISMYHYYIYLRDIWVLLIDIVLLVIKSAKQFHCLVKYCVLSHPCLCGLVSLFVQCPAPSFSHHLLLRIAILLERLCSIFFQREISQNSYLRGYSGDHRVHFISLLISSLSFSALPPSLLSLTPYIWEERTSL